jgi:hypothetical protein
VSERARAQDELKAAAWKLAAIDGRAAARRYLDEVGQEIDQKDWERTNR